MSGRGLRGMLYAGLVVAYLLHNDLWLWDDPRLIAGLPVGLLYHVLFCFAVAGLMAALSRFAWPAELERETEDR